MRQIYNFEPTSVPVVTERMLVLRQEKRKQNRLLAAAAVVLQICMVLLAVLLRNACPSAAILCAAYAVLSLLGGIVVSWLLRKNMVVPQT